MMIKFYLAAMESVAPHNSHVWSDDSPHDDWNISDTQIIWPFTSDGRLTDDSEITATHLRLFLLMSRLHIITAWQDTSI